MPEGREETVSDREILLVFAESDDPVLFTEEVAEEIGFSNQGTLPRLRELEEKRFLESKSGGRVPVWWLSKDGENHLREEI